MYKRKQLPTEVEQLEDALACDDVIVRALDPRSQEKYSGFLNLWNDFVRLRARGLLRAGKPADVGHLPVYSDDGKTTTREGDKVVVLSSVPLLQFAIFLQERREDSSTAMSAVLAMLERDGQTALSPWMVQDAVAACADMERKAPARKTELVKNDRLIRDASESDFVLSVFASQAGLREVSADQLAPADIAIIGEKDVTVVVDRDKAAGVEGRVIRMGCTCLDPDELAVEIKRWKGCRKQVAQPGPQAHRERHLSGETWRAAATPEGLPRWDISVIERPETVYCFTHNPWLRARLGVLKKDMPQVLNLDKLARKFGSSSRAWRVAYATDSLRREWLDPLDQKACVKCRSLRQGWTDFRKWLTYGHRYRDKEWTIKTYRAGKSADCVCKSTQQTLYAALELGPKDMRNRPPAPVRRRNVTAEQKMTGSLKKGAKEVKDLIFERVAPASSSSSSARLPDAKSGAGAPVGGGVAAKRPRVAK